MAGGPCQGCACALSLTAFHCPWVGTGPAACLRGVATDDCCDRQLGCCHPAGPFSAHVRPPTRPPAAGRPRGPGSGGGGGGQQGGARRGEGGERGFARVLATHGWKGTQGSLCACSHAADERACNHAGAVPVPLWWASPGESSGAQTLRLHKAARPVQTVRRRPHLTRSRTGPARLPPTTHAPAAWRLPDPPLCQSWRWQCP